MQCYQPCVMCKDDCGQECIHNKCNLNCSQPCNKEYCQLPCTKLLKCGHPCIGLCGDPCPAVCRICQPHHETFQIFFGVEDNPESKFVKIDCGHILEQRCLDRMIDTESVNRIKFPQCPKCKTMIKKTSRYQNRINKVLLEMNIIKSLLIKKNQEALENSIIMSQMLQQISRRLTELTINDHQTRVRQALEQYMLLLAYTSKNESRLQSCYIKLDLLSMLISFGSYLSKNEQSQVGNQTYSKVQKFFNLIFDQRFIVSEDLKNEMRSLIKIIDENQIREDIKMNMKAFNLGQGHFYKCPNGHYYVIGESVGPIKESKCNECGAKIGGTDHRLTQGNQYAAIDDSQSAAWDPRGFDQMVLDGRVNLDLFVR